MNLYLISQDENDGYDTYDSAVVCAPDEKTARSINPANGFKMEASEWLRPYSSWCHSIGCVKAKLIGKAKRGTKQGLVLASFNAG